MKKKELARLRDAVEYVAAVHDNARDFIAEGLRGMNELRDALTRATEEVKAARAVLEATEARERAATENVPIAS